MSVSIEHSQGAPDMLRLRIEAREKPRLDLRNVPVTRDEAAELVTGLIPELADVDVPALVKVLGRSLRGRVEELQELRALARQLAEATSPTHVGATRVPGSQWVALTERRSVRDRNGGPQLRAEAKLLGAVEALRLAVGLVAAVSPADGDVEGLWWERHAAIAALTDLGDAVATAVSHLRGLPHAQARAVPELL